jgi:hypothetical protein
VDIYENITHADMTTREISDFIQDHCSEVLDDTIFGIDPLDQYYYFEEENDKYTLIINPNLSYVQLLHTSKMPKDYVIDWRDAGDGKNYIELHPGSDELKEWLKEKYANRIIKQADVEIKLHRNEK